jgi:hypothetical protein
MADPSTVVRHRAIPRAAPLLALALGCVLAPPTHLVLGDSGTVDVTIGWFVPAFVVAFVFATAVACRMRSIANAGYVLVAIAMVVAVALGRGSLQATVIGVIVAIVVAGAVLALAGRDWREPAGGALVGFALALGAECLAASGAQRSWAPVLVLTVPVVWAASLAARGAAVWFDTAEPGPEQDAWFKRTTAVAAAGGLVTLGGALLGGTIDRVGSLLAPIGAWLFSAVTALVAQLVRPVMWLMDQVHVDPEGLRKVVERIHRNADATRRAVAEQQRTAGSGVGVARVLAFVFLVAFVAGVVLVIRRLRSRAAPEEIERAAPGSHVEQRPLTELDEDLDDRSMERPYPLPPRDPVRRAYVEALESLAARGFHKDPAATPAEFSQAVGERAPALAPDLAAITHTYERVRYGGAPSTRDDARSMTAHRRALIRLLPRSMPPPEPA